MKTEPECSTTFYPRMVVKRANECNKFMNVNKDKILMVHLPDVFLRH